MRTNDGYDDKIAKNLYKLGHRQGDIAGLFARPMTFITPSIFACYLFVFAVYLVKKLITRMLAEYLRISNFLIEPSEPITLKCYHGTPIRH